MHQEDQIDVPHIVASLSTKVLSGAAAMEVADAFINASNYVIHQAILDQFGDIDLSEPAPDLSVGWTRIRSQLAVNCLYVLITKQIAEKS